MKSLNKTTSLNILSTFFLQGLSMLTSPIFSRMLGPENYGIVAVYNTWVSVITVIFGIQTQSTLAVARNEFKENEQIKYQSSVLCLSILSYFLFTLVMIISIVPMSGIMNLEKSMFILMLMQGLGQFCINFINIKFTYEFRADRNLILSLITSISYIMISIILISIMPKSVNYWGRIIGMAVTYVILGFIVCGYIFIHGKTFYNARYWRFCMPLAIPIIFHNLSGILLNQSDRIMLQQFTDNISVGVYSLAFGFGNVLSAIWNSLNNSWVPFYYEFTRHNKIDEMKQHARNYLELYTVLSIGFVLLAPEVFHVFASQEYWGGTSLIPIFCSGFFMVFLYSFPVNFEFYNKSTKLIAFGTISAAICNILLNIVMIRSLGITGAAFATTIAHSLQFLFHHLCATHFIKKETYPFSISFFLPYLSIYLLFAIFCYQIEGGAWIVRWILGTIIGTWEIGKIIKRKEIF